MHTVYDFQSSNSGDGVFPSKPSQVRASAKLKRGADMIGSSIVRKYEERIYIINVNNLGNFVLQRLKETRHRRRFTHSFIPGTDLQSHNFDLQIMSSSPASTQAVASIASYCLANMAMTVTNKYVFSVRCPFHRFPRRIYKI